MLALLGLLTVLTLLVLAGLVSAVGAESNLNVSLNLWVVLIGLFVAATLGAEVVYLIGLKAGPPLHDIAALGRI